MFIKVAFLLTNPFSDLIDPDCLNLCVSWNKNLKNRSSHNDKAPGDHFFQTKMAELIRTKFESLKWNENLKPVSVPI